jgi:hypothetical protein
VKLPNFFVMLRNSINGVKAGGFQF